MKKKMIFGLLMGLLAISAMAQDPVWYENYDDAMAVAKESGKPVFLDFSGSDWCIWCQRLNQEVLTQQAFKDYAKDNLVLVLADFPKGKAQSQTIKNQNQKLAQKFQVRGFPTVILVSPEGESIAQTGYVQGGADAYVTHLKGLLKPKADK